jgi:uncharacterized membrane protein HdeD (DUF308 family)
MNYDQPSSQAHRDFYVDVGLFMLLAAGILITLAGTLAHQASVQWAGHLALVIGVLVMVVATRHRKSCRSAGCRRDPS